MMRNNFLYPQSKINHIVKTIERAKQTRSIEQQFLDDLVMSIEKDCLKDNRRPSLTYKPSSMNCMRQSFYLILNVYCPPDKQTYSSCGICESGTDRHERIQKAIAGMRDNGFDCDYVDVETYIKQHNLIDLEVKSKSGMETKVYNKKLNMSFLTDGIIKYKQRYFIFEFKTEVSNKFRNRINIDPAHISQGTAYSDAFNINDVMFLYENRDTCEKKVYLLNVTPEDKFNRIHKYIKDCDEYIKNKIVPPMPQDPALLKKCRYCPYRARCASDGPVSYKLNMSEVKFND